MESEIGASIRQLTADDFDDLLALYRELNSNVAVADGLLGRDLFAQMLALPGTCIWGAQVGSSVVSVATLHILPNLTYSGRPYSLIENVVTLRQQQGRGFGRQVMTAAIDHAWAANAYKVMLLTGQASGARSFYEKLGFRGDEKHGMVIRRAPTRTPPSA